jgi:hypothetical protein
MLVAVISIILTALPPLPFSNPSQHVYLLQRSPGTMGCQLQSHVQIYMPALLAP